MVRVIIAKPKLPPKPELEGTSLRQLLRSPGALWGRPALTTHGKDNHTLRSKQWRYIRYADQTEELYNHDDDPNEWTNLAANPESAEQHRELMDSLRDQLPADFLELMTDKQEDQ